MWIPLAIRAAQMFGMGVAGALGFKTGEVAFDKVKDLINKRREEKKHAAPQPA